MISTASYAACDGGARVKPPLKPQALPVDFKAWLKDQHDDEDPMSGEFYVVDIDNDGQDEIVRTRVEGSGHYLYMNVYKRSPDGTFSIQDLPTPQGMESDEWARFPYYNRLTQKTELFTTLCGKTYFSLGSGGDSTREAWFWDTKGLRPACDPAWAAYVRADFKKVYDEKKYELAANILSPLTTDCAKELDAETRAWIANDMAITQYKLGEPQRCLEYVQQARQSPKVQSAAQYNEKLCKEAVANRSTDFKWLLDKGLSSTNQIYWDKRFASLLHAVIPDLKEAPEKLRKHAEQTLVGPPDEKRVEAGRYVTISAGYPHSATVTVMMWFDVDKGAGLLALNKAAEMIGVDSCYYAIASRSVASKDISPFFWKAFNQFRQENGYEKE